MKTFANLIREAWFQKRRSVGAFACAVGTSIGYCSSLMKGSHAPPRPRILRRMARYLGLDYEELLALAHLEKRPRDLRISTLHDLAGRILADEADARQEKATARRRSAGMR